MVLGGQRHIPAILPPGKRPGTHFTGGWMGHRTGLEGRGKSRAHQDQSTDRPACNESLYRLSVAF